jgi:choline transport protein
VHSPGIAFNSLVGAAVILQQATVFLCISLLLYHRRSEQVLPASRPFRLPNWLGYLVNIVSVAFTVITSTFFMFPSSTSVEDDTMSACSDRNNS